ncbi:VOC family protein [Deinococcus yavapaiensis]|uniref:Catechol 2,3-dioxygenase n=1 Tax=Deinococcus yavapaiensis KR-236 TaxID=694435 RepID=A0A318S582_9DEIO|nr:VOC family protein [Deinococcus yavapaiensis]PYE48355.1 catechol 2,3-dioxygenase [Deinococcus yavapaiensis KR-236]
MTHPTAQAAHAARIDPKLTLGEVALTVHNLSVVTRFYQGVIGLTLLAQDEERAVLGTPDGHPLVTLRRDPHAPTPPSNATGLYHLAIAFPTRPDLARWLKHAAALNLRLGQSDHLTHEAFYFNDPEGNGIEMYTDWPQEQWPFKDGKFTADAAERKAIDIQGLLGTLADDDAGWKGAPIGTRMGHVHLKMSDPRATRAFYESVLGFDIGFDDMGAVFAGAGGYHHHVGNNAWHSAGGPTPPQGALGLRHYVIELSSAQELDAVTARLKNASIAVHETPAGPVVRDAAGNRVLLRSAPSTVESALTALD